MAGGHSEAKPSNAVFYIIAIAWLLVILAVVYLYFAHRATLYLDTVPPEVVATSTLSIGSPAFVDGGSIPSMYTCDAKQISPPLSITDVPSDARSLVLIMEDRDIPKQLKDDGVFVHWVITDMPATTTVIGDGELVGVLGAAGNGVAGYVGPCPPREYDPARHHYYFDLYALDTTLGLPEGAPVETIRAAMDGHVLAHGVLVGTYERPQE